VPRDYGAAVTPGGKSICSEVRETRSQLRHSRGRMSGGHSQQGGELLPPAAAQLEAGAVVHDQHELAVEIGLELPNAGDVHDGRPVYPEELPWVESGLELAHGFAEQVESSSRVHSHTVVGRLDPVDLRHPEKGDAAVVLEREPLRVGRWGIGP